MCTLLKIKQLINDGTIHFRTKKPGEIECCIYPDITFDFLDPAKNVCELMTQNSTMTLCRKFVKNVKVLSKHLPDVYTKISTCLSVKL